MGPGNFHFGYLIDPTLPEEREEAEALNHELVNHALSLEGTCAGTHGVGLHKMDFLAMEAGDGAVEMMRTIKRALDPKDIMNPGNTFLTPQRSRRPHAVLNSSMPSVAVNSCRSNVCRRMSVRD